MIEIWKDITQTEGKYQISNLGRIRNYITGQVRQPFTRNNGYLSTKLKCGNKRKHFYVHRLVAEQFLEHVEGKDIVNHINGIRDDNRVENLEWVTPSENSLHAIYVLGKR